MLQRCFNQELILYIVIVTVRLVLSCFVKFVRMVTRSQSKNRVIRQQHCKLVRETHLFSRALQLWR